MNEKIEFVRSTVRAGVTVILVMTLCIACFRVVEHQEFLLGGLIGGLSTAMTFYFKKSEDGS